jgi:hypothetical protein
MACVILESVFKLPRFIVYPATIVADAAILIVAAFKISAMNRRAEKARREAYRRKFEGSLEALKEWSERRSSGTTGEKKS